MSETFKPAYSFARRFAAITLCVVALSTSSAANAGDPCELVMCMWGRFSKVTGSGDDGGNECRRAEAEYFSIIVYKKKGRIDWNATADERLSRQNSCPTADRGKTKEINDKFGKEQG